MRILIVICTLCLAACGTARYDSSTITRTSSVGFEVSLSDIDIQEEYVAFTLPEEQMDSDLVVTLPYFLGIQQLLACEPDDQVFLYKLAEKMERFKQSGESESIPTVSRPKFEARSIEDGNVRVTYSCSDEPVSNKAV